MPTNRQIFITATDTGVGKTLVSGLLLGYLLKQGVKAGYQKWVATGVEDSVEDLERVRQLAGLTGQPAAPLELQVPYRFPFAASPHLAAEVAGREIEAGTIVRTFEEMRKRYEVLLVEGVGGLLVPLSRDLLLADMVARLKIPTLLVARTCLGTVNHTLLSLEAMRSRRIPVLGVLLTDGPAEDETIAVDNLKTIAEIGQVTVFGRLPFHRDDSALRKAFSHLGTNILQALQPAL